MVTHQSDRIDSSHSMSQQVMTKALDVILLLFRMVSELKGQAGSDRERKRQTARRRAEHERVGAEKARNKAGLKAWSD